MSQLLYIYSSLNVTQQEEKFSCRLTKKHDLRYLLACIDFVFWERFS